MAPYHSAFLNGLSGINGIKGNKRTMKGKNKLQRVLAGTHTAFLEQQRQ
jgi:hypothetical protein